MERLFYLVAFFLLAQCATVEESNQSTGPFTGQGIAQDWLIENDLLVEFFDENVVTCVSMQVFKRHEDSPSRNIYFGTYPDEKIELTAWKVRKQELDKLLKQPQFSFENLLQNPDQVNELKSLIAYVGEPIGQVINSDAYSKGSIFQDRSAKIVGKGTVPRLSDIPGEFDDETRIVAMINTKMQKDESKAGRVQIARTYIQPTESMLQVIATKNSDIHFKKANYSVLDRNNIGTQETVKPAILSENKKAFGIELKSIPYDHHVEIEASIVR